MTQEVEKLKSENEKLKTALKMIVEMNYTTESGAAICFLTAKSICEATLNQLKQLKP